MITQGIHHVTAIASDAQQNYDFYTRILGLRLVKRTVNFDDPGSYHLYFGDEAGAPGTIITFFPWPRAARGRIGAGYVVATAFVAPAGSLSYWKDRLISHGVADPTEFTRFHENVLSFQDPDGMVLEIVEDDSVAEIEAWKSDVPHQYALRGFHSITISERTLADTEAVLTHHLGYLVVSTDGNRHRYKASGIQPGLYVDILVDPNAGRGSLGAGSVHHVAFRAMDDTEQSQIRDELLAAAYNVSAVMDRNYFHSIYFRERGGVLFEIATNAPGFAVDEPAETLGQALKLPAQFEKHRTDIENALPTLEVKA